MANGTISTTITMRVVVLDPPLLFSACADALAICVGVAAVVGEPVALGDGVLVAVGVAVGVDVTVAVAVEVALEVGVLVQRVAVAVRNNASC